MIFSKGYDTSSAINLIETYNPFPHDEEKAKEWRTDFLRIVIADGGDIEQAFCKRPLSQLSLRSFEFTSDWRGDLERLYIENRYEKDTLRIAYLKFVGDRMKLRCVPASIITEHPLNWILGEGKPTRLYVYLCSVPSNKCQAMQLYNVEIDDAAYDLLKEYELCGDMNKFPLRVINIHAALASRNYINVSLDRLEALYNVIDSAAFIMKKDNYINRVLSGLKDYGIKYTFEEFEQSSLPRSAKIILFRSNRVSFKDDEEHIIATLKYAS